jgi:hypothetical protein
LQSNYQIKQQKVACFETKSVPGKKSLAILFEEFDALKRKLQLKPEKIASNKTSAKED